MFPSHTLTGDGRERGRKRNAKLFKGNRSSFLDCTSAFFLFLLTLTIFYIFFTSLTNNTFPVWTTDKNWARMRKFSRFYNRKVPSNCTQWKWMAKFMNEKHVAGRKTKKIAQAREFSNIFIPKPEEKGEKIFEKPQKENSLIPKVNRCFAPAVCSSENVFSRFVKHVYGRASVVEA